MLQVVTILNTFKRKWNKNWDLDTGQNFFMLQQYTSNANPCLCEPLVRLRTGGSENYCRKYLQQKFCPGKAVDFSCSGIKMIVFWDAVYSFQHGVVITVSFKLDWAVCSEMPLSSPLLFWAVICLIVHVLWFLRSLSPKCSHFWHGKKKNIWKQFYDVQTCTRHLYSNTQQQQTCLLCLHDEYKVICPFRGLSICLKGHLWYCIWKSLHLNRSFPPL